jgi:hypothetical protein
MPQRWETWGCSLQNTKCAIVSGSLDISSIQRPLTKPPDGASEMADLTLPEEWRVIDEFPNYEVSDHGRVRRAVAALNYKGGIIRPAGFPLRPSPDLDGYLLVRLYQNGKGSMRRICRLVCAAFHGAPPTPKHQAAHNDGNINNNSSSNLRWATSFENHQDRDRHGTTTRGEIHWSAKLTENDVRTIRERRRNGETCIVIAADYGVSIATVGDISLGRKWAWLT